VTRAAPAIAILAVALPVSLAAGILVGAVPIAPGDVLVIFPHETCPADGIVVQVHDGEIDHVGRRSQLTLVPYMLGQPARLRQGMAAIAGNYLIVALRQSGAFVALAHLRTGSIRVAIGEEVTAGQPVADCGNSGNSTQPHVHVQVMDSLDLSVARGVPMAFRRFREWPRGAKQFRIREAGLPDEGAVVEPT